MIIRRIITLGSLMLITPSALALAPLIFLTAYAASFSSRYITAPHAVAFLYGYLWFEWRGLMRLTRAWLFAKDHAAMLERTRAVQFWWARQLLDLGIKIFRIKISVQGADVVQGRCAIVASRHSSMGDTVLPLLFFGKAREEGLRYILKQELLLVPCLDIGGNRLPNVFVDRSGTDTNAALEEVRALVSTAGDDESVLIYPEGTRFTRKKQDQLKANKPQLIDQLDRWPDLLPPRLGGITAILEENPGKDLVFLAHVGFEGSANIPDLLNGGWLHQEVLLEFWRVPFAELPKQDFQEFLFGHWDQMQATVARLQQQIDDNAAAATPLN